MKKTILQRIVSRCELVKRQFVDPLDRIPELSQLLDPSVQVRSGNRALCHQNIARALVFGVQYVAESGGLEKGDIVEFGCMTGRTTTAIAAAMASWNLSTIFHVFDGFQGLPVSTIPADINAPHVQSGVWDAGTCKGKSQSEIQSLLKSFLPERQFVIHDGWYCETSKSYANRTQRKVSMIHLDCDLASSTIDALIPFFERRIINDGAVIMFDDWFHHSSDPELGQQAAWSHVAEQCPWVRVVDSSNYSWCGKKLIVRCA